MNSNHKEANEDTREHTKSTTNMKNDTQVKIQISNSHSDNKEMINPNTNFNTNSQNVSKGNSYLKHNVEQEHNLYNFIPADDFDAHEFNKINLRASDSSNPKLSSVITNYNNSLNTKIYNNRNAPGTQQVNLHNNETIKSMVGTLRNPPQNYLNKQELNFYPESSHNPNIQNQSNINLTNPSQACMSSNSMNVNYSNLFALGQTNDELVGNETNAIHSNTYGFNNSNNIPLNFPIYDEEKLLNSLIFLAKDQIGCRLLQKKIDSNSSWGTEKVFPIIMMNGDLLEMILDPFGNYLIQKLIEYLEEDDLGTIISHITPVFYKIGVNLHGTRVLQKLVERLENQKLFQQFMISIQPHFFDLMKNVNGTHIIIKISSTLKSVNIEPLYDCIDENLIDLATNKHSCSTFQKYITNAKGEHRENLIEKIIENTLILMSDQYGNYLVQFVISLNNHLINSKISTFLKNKISYLARQKYSSNVIEKLFHFCDEQTRLNMIKEICNPKTIVELLLDIFGNYSKKFH